jgi:hypothetical protein
MTNLCDDCIHAMVRMILPPVAGQSAEPWVTYCDKIGAVTPTQISSCRYRQTDEQPRETSRILLCATPEERLK